MHSIAAEGPAKAKQQHCSEFRLCYLWKTSCNSRPDHKYSQAKDMVPCTATHALTSAIYSQTISTPTNKMERGYRKRKNYHPPPPPEDKHCIFFLLESFKSVFQELSSSISSSTSSNISELRLPGSEGCFLE